MKIFAFLIVVFIAVAPSFGQGLQADFTLPTSACINQLIKPLNNSTGVSRWDFCHGDLATTPSATSVVNLAGNVTTGIDLIFDGENWFGFVVNQNGNTITRLSYGADLNTTPVVTNLGNFQNTIIKPADIKVVYDNGWHGFVYSMDAPLLSRIDFGSSLNNIPATATAVIAASGSTNGGFDMIRTGSGWVAVATTPTGYHVSKLASITSIPTPADILSGIANPFGIANGDLVLVQSGANYYGYSVAYGNNSIQRLVFGTNPFSTPTFQNLGTISDRPYGIDIAQDAGNYYLFLSTLEGPLYRIALGADLSTTPGQPESLGTFSLLSNNIKLRLAKHNSTWMIFTTDFNSSALFRLKFPEPPDCAASIPYANEREPKVSFGSSGTQYVSLRSFDQGYFRENQKSLTITPSVAPGINLHLTNICAGNVSNFSAAVTDVASLSWDFGDQTFGAGEQVTHTYVSGGAYEVSVSGVAQNGCPVQAVKSIKIYDPPLPDFSTPSGLICTNNEFTFSNQTSDVFDSNLSYKWYFNNSLVSTDRDLKYTFASGGDHTIKLQALIPGCSIEKVKTISNVGHGPTVGFAIDGSCDNERIKFQNTSAGAIASHYWIFSDGSTSVDENVSRKFPVGNYVARLMTTGTNGCESILEKTFEVFPAPTVDYKTVISLLCTKSPITLLDQTPIPSGTTLTSWEWNFGDGSTSTTKNPVYHFAQPGAYEVQLRVSTEDGCAGMLKKSLTILPVPNAEFASGKICLSESVALEAAESSAKAYQWKIDDKIYTNAKPSHVFRSAGEHVATLKVTGQNGCEATLAKTLVVPPPLQPAFSIQKNCAGADALLTDITAGTEMIVAWAWASGNQTRTGQQVSYRWNTEGDRIVNLKVTTAAGCSYSADQTVNVVPFPNADFSMSQNIGTAPVAINFLNKSKHAGLFQWSFGDAATSNEISPTHQFTANGTYQVSLGAKNHEGCEDTHTESISLSIAAPDINIVGIVTGDNPDGSIKITVTLQNDGNTVVENLPINIDMSDEIAIREVIEDKILPSSRYTFALPYGIRRSQSLQFVCAEASLLNDLDLSGNRSCIQFKNEVLVLPGYPNPAKDFLTVEWLGDREEFVTISILNSLGRVVRDASVASQKGFNREVLNIQTFEKGVYLLVLKGKSTRVTQHIIVAN